MPNRLGLLVLFVTALVFAALPSPASDHNDPNSMNPILGNVPVNSADLTGIFGWPTNDGGRIIFALPFAPVPATGSFDTEVMYRIRVNPEPRVGRRSADTTLDSLLDYVKRGAEDVLNETPYEVRVTFNNPHEAVVDFIDFPGGTFRKVVVTDEIYHFTTPGGHRINLFIGGRDDPFFFELPGFRRSINYAPEFFNVPIEASPDKRELPIPKSLLYLQGNDLINNAARPSYPPDYNYSRGPLLISTQKPPLPDVPLTWSGNSYVKDTNGNYQFMYNGVDAQKGLNINAIIVEMPLGYVTKDPQNERIVNVWAESWVLKSANRFPAVPNSSGSNSRPQPTQNKYRVQLTKYKRVDTAGVPLADTILSLSEDNRQIGPDNVSLATWFVRRFAHLGWGFGPSMTAMGLPTCFDHGDVKVSKLVNYVDPLTAFVPVAKCLFQELNMPDGWNPRNKSIPLKRPFGIVIPNVNAVDMDTTGTWPYGLRPDDQVGTRFAALFLDHTKNCGSKKCTLESLDDPALWNSLPVTPKTPPNPLHNDKPYLAAFPYLAEPSPRP